MKVGVLATMVFAISIGYPIASFAGLAPDADGDGIPDVLDKCTLDSRNATAPATVRHRRRRVRQRVRCRLRSDVAVIATDFSMFFVPAFKGLVSPTRGQDMDCNGAVLGSDYTMFFVPKFKGLLGGAVPGPSGLSCAGTPGCS
jgi:hypothetical protein